MFLVLVRVQKFSVFVPSKSRGQLQISLIAARVVTEVPKWEEFLKDSHHGRRAPLICAPCMMCYAKSGHHCRRRSSWLPQMPAFPGSMRWEGERWVQKMTGDAHSIEETIVRDLARFSFFPPCFSSSRYEAPWHSQPWMGSLILQSFSFLLDNNQQAKDVLMNFTRKSMGFASAPMQGGGRTQTGLREDLEISSAEWCSRPRAPRHEAAVGAFFWCVTKVQKTWSLAIETGDGSDRWGA